MKNIYILVFIFSFLKYGKTEITKEDMQLLENNILEAISHLSWKIDGVSSKVTNIEERIVILEPQIGITENVVDDINEKISLIPRETKQIVTSIDQMTISVIDSVVTGLNVLRHNITLEDKEEYTKITEHFEGINSTLNSLEIKIEKDLENVTQEITSRTYNVETNIGIKMKEEITPIKKAVDIAYNAIHPKVVNINSEVALIKSSINTIQPKVVNINSEVAVIKSSINTIQPKVVNINSEVELTKSQINAIQPKVVNIYNEVELIKSNINAIQPKVGSIYNEVELTKSNINAIQPKVFSLYNDVEIIISNISDVKKNISQKLESIKEGVQDLMPQRNCADLYNQGRNISGPAKIAPKGCCNIVSVICDQDSDGGGWTIIQKRQVVEPRENFNRGWEDYSRGFGNMTGSGEYWMGLALLHTLSQQGNQELHIELEDWEGDTRWAKYSTFYVGPPEDNYRLKITGYSGRAGDAMYYSNGQAFSTHDRDNDAASSRSCASIYKSGWWYDSCALANLNGEPHRGTATKKYHGIRWNQWRGSEYSLRGVTMKIRPTTE
ncbi:unnamed protein product [Meganyctiphanes norvegica]|uniref:Fibrinogen C-terminal domain-containing protein n=1 Tax=Meganyctiphanes norvegica TaxID=48144 RepID=A0AAV2R040_MEGNR